MIGLACLVVAALFTGAAFYINFAEHPARMVLPPEQALMQWAPAYARGYLMQASLAVLGGVGGIFAWWQSGAPIWLAGAALMLANWPWTLLVIMPVNRRLLAMIGKGGEGAAPLLSRWAMLHGVRTLLGCLALLCFAFGLSGAHSAA